MFRVIITTGLLVLSITFATASPVKRCIKSNEQSCFLGNEDVKPNPPADPNELALYTNLIGVTFADGIGCPGVEGALLAKIGGALEQFTCQDDGYGHTKLSWVSPYNHGGNINDVLTGMYPMIAGGFNCPKPDPVQSEKRSSAADCPPLPNTSTCLTQDGFIYPFKYTVNVGVTFDNGNGCAGIGNNLKDKIDNVDKFQCYNDGYGNTVLSFTVLGRHASEINAVLQEIYPMVIG
ncbi:hypothetical protein LTR56_016971 [Elasticomyces elasticus]|nr:hypothetical protein LTR56_016971 [Elasticomyces elasticus]KAK3640465.1 hypothetical protein LTR22_017023 [Elasticomyces elasticus]KAK4931156.1 hypothetical protein LTR49_002209 [Elasticomyces elasticus]KAK5767913.1 hypothetical protein LTS12_002070 [Elasticomyces elasticus]